MLDAIKQWAFTLVITAIVGGVANSLSLSDNGGMKKYVKFACSAVALAVMIMPIKTLFTQMPEMFNLYNNYPAESETSDYTYDLNELTIAKTNELLKLRIYDIVYEKTGIKPDDIYIYIKQDDYSDIGIEKIILVMPENTDENKISEVKIYLKQIFNCDVGRGDPDAPLINDAEEKINE